MWFGLLLILAVAVVLVFSVWRDRRLSEELQILLREHNFKPRESRSIPAPFVYERLDHLVCFDGDLRPGMPITLLLGTRRTGIDKHRITYYYTGIYFPPQVQLNDHWLERWKRMVAERGDDWAVHSGVQKTEKIGDQWVLPIPSRSEQCAHPREGYSWHGTASMYERISRQEWQR
jgi:hypothetical protein